jgi:hypothetical protein
MDRGINLDLAAGSWSLLIWASSSHRSWVEVSSHVLLLLPLLSRFALLPWRELGLF